jgi:prefoldin subunit 5
MARMQESASQMCQIAAECRILDEEIEKASAQIERNINKAINGVEKHIGELVRKWGAG